MNRCGAYTNLVGEIAKKHLTNAEIAKELNIHQNTLRNKIKGESSFTVEEAFEIRRLFFPNTPIDFLFSKEPESITESAV